uniref:Hydrophobic seed protein domain-containing protein n=1 Tax=Aegilops tauschii TaxID=37682 RepID=N1QRA4_AEGTA
METTYKRGQPRRCSLPLHHHQVKALNINLMLPISIELLVNQCGKRVPKDFRCPN